MKTLKAMLVNGSPHPDGVCSSALNLIKGELEKEGIETRIIQLGAKDIRGCIACGYCKKHGRCVFNDIVNETANDLKEADILVCASPTYYANANSTLLSYLTRLFYSTPFSKEFKIGASIGSARRAGAVNTFDEINKFFTIASMPVASSCYWNVLYGNNAEEASRDLEGQDIMKQLGRNISFLAKSVALGKEQIGLPEPVDRHYTNFIS